MVKIRELQKIVMPKMPPSRLAWTLFIPGVLFLAFSMWIQTRMWMVEFGAWRVAAGGGEYMLALFLGVPTLLMALACLGATVIKRTWRSFLSCLAFIMALVPFFGWLVLIVKEIL